MPTHVPTCNSISVDIEPCTLLLLFIVEIKMKHYFVVILLKLSTRNMYVCIEIIGVLRPTYEIFYLALS
jgi:hypothetical protein